MLSLLVAVLLVDSEVERHHNPTPSHLSGSEN